MISNLVVDVLVCPQTAKSTLNQPHVSQAAPLATVQKDPSETAEDLFFGNPNPNGATAATSHVHPQKLIRDQPGTCWTCWTWEGEAHLDI